MILTALPAKLKPAQGASYAEALVFVNTPPSDFYDVAIAAVSSEQTFSQTLGPGVVAREGMQICASAEQVVAGAEQMDAGTIEFYGYLVPSSAAPPPS